MVVSRREEWPQRPKSRVAASGVSWIYTCRRPSSGSNCHQTTNSGRDFRGYSGTGRRSTEPVRSANPAAAGVSLASAASFGRSQAKLLFKAQWSRTRSLCAPLAHTSAIPAASLAHVPPVFLVFLLPGSNQRSCAAAVSCHLLVGPSRAEFSFLSAGTVEWSPALLVENRHLARTLLLALSGEDARVSNAPIAVMRLNLAWQRCIA